VTETPEGIPLCKNDKAMTARRALGMAIGVGAGGLLAAKLARAARAIEFTGLNIVMFGGSRGLGLVMARELGAEGARLMLIARDQDELDYAEADLIERGASVSTYVCDVRDRGQVEATIRQIAREHDVIDVLINVAGVIQVGPFEHMTIADFDDAMATHFWGPLYTVLAALPYMRRAGARRIVNISSIGGKLAVPHLLPYSASKFALVGLSEGLQAELAGEGFAVTTVCPGLMRTGSTYNAWFKGQYRREFAWFHMADSTPGLSISATRAARQIIDACRHGDAELILTPAARAAVLLKALAPHLVARAMALANRVLPSADESRGNEARSGWQSVSRLAPSPLTALSERATIENNELP
jgi:NAD(P)-dependent dehydrogenase (short-subunit alcohol dehydrogenase family)